jgi:PAS domain S-box-containing protein
MLQTHSARYALYGAGFGLLFPLGSMLLEAYLQALPWTWGSVLSVQTSQPLLWVIDTAPFVLAWFATLIGRRQDLLTGQNSQLEQQLRELLDNPQPGPGIYEELIRSAVGEVEAKLGDMLDATPASFALIGPDGELLFMNRRGLDMLEAENLPSVFGQSAYEFVEASHRDKFIRFHEEVCAGRSGALTFEIVGLQGTRRWIESWASPHRVQGESVQVAISSDITDRIAKEKKLERQRLELQQAQKLATIGEFAAGLGHEINNPLAIISGSAGLLLMELDEGLSDVDWARTELETIEETAARIRSIADGLKTLARSDNQGARARVSLQKMVDATQALCRPLLAKSDVRLTVEVADDAEAFTNSVQVEQVLMNLVSNALHAVRALPEPWIAIRGSSRGSGMVRVSVTDCGHLTDLTVIERMHEPFFTTKPEGEGTGLGLSVSRALMEGLGGSLTFDRDSVNTTFHVDIPAFRP